MLMISCKKAAELICESLDRRLSLYEAAQLRLHVLLCGGCRAFRAQNKALLQLFEERFRHLPEDRLDERLDALPPEMCARLKEKLREAAREDADREGQAR